MLQITSAKNPRIQNLIRLREKSSERIKQQLFVMEGIRELSLAVKNGYIIKEIYFCPGISGNTVKDEYFKLLPGIEWIEVTSEVYDKIAVRGSTEGVMAIAVMKEHLLDNIVLSTNPLLLVAEKVEKPGNLGALLRSADAAGLDAVILCEPLFDLYNSNVIRSGIGTLFTMQVALATTTETIKWLNTRQIKTYAATPSAKMNYTKPDYTSSSAIVVGSEAEGLSPEWLQNAGQPISIPMKGDIDSLNVSVSAAIIIFEALRQRA